MTSVIGHRAEIAGLLADLRGDRPHHGWLLAGVQGLGKAKIAHAVAARLLAEAAGPQPEGAGPDLDPDHPTAKLIAAWSHPDFLLLDRLPADRKLRDKPRVDWPEPLELARNINVEQVRDLNAKFALRPSFSDRRFVVIDSIDDLERGAANALLKTLEEPPSGTTFLLVTHAPGRLLPTIRSRCRLVRFGPLSPEDMKTVLREEIPEADYQELADLVEAGDGVPGRALGFAGLDIAGLDRAMAQIAQTGDPSGAERIALAKSLSLKAAQPRYEVFLQRAPAFLAEAAKSRGGSQLADTLAAWEEARTLAASAVGLSLEPYSVVLEIGTLIAGLWRREAA